MWGDTENARCGSFVQYVDVSGDGLDDIVVACADEMHIWFGRPTLSNEPDAVIDCGNRSHGLHPRCELAHVDDVTGDGIPDLVAVDHEGRVSGFDDSIRVWYGGDLGGESNWEVGYDLDAWYHNDELISLHDLSTDGIPDIVVQNPWFDITHGRIRIWLGGQLTSEAQYVQTGAAGEFLGRGRSVFLDLTGDGGDLLFRSKDVRGLVDECGTDEWTLLTFSNEPPTVSDRRLQTDEDVSLSISLSETSEGWVRGYSVVREPRHGVLTGTPPSVTYLPDRNYFGEDDFAFVADGWWGNRSGAAEVAIDVLPVNDPPEFTSTPPTDRVKPASSWEFVRGRDEFSYEITTADVEMDNVTITATAPAWLVLTDHGDGTALLRGSPTSHITEPQAVELTARDSAGDQAVQRFDIEGLEPTDPPPAAVVTGSRCGCSNAPNRTGHIALVVLVLLGGAYRRFPGARDARL